MSAGSFTLKFDGWAPDLQNVALEADGSSGSIPCADCLNVYYQDAAFRCLPRPNPYAPSLGTQALTLLSGFDNISGNNYLYAGTVNGVSRYQSGVWSSVPVEPSVTVGLTGLSMGFSQGGTGHLGSTQHVNGTLARFSTGTVTVSGGGIYGGTLVGGQKGSGLSAAYGYGPGFVGGSLSPTTTYQGTAILAIDNSSSRTVLTLNGTLPQNYFRLLYVSGATVATSSVLTFQQASGQTTWVWNGSIGIASGTTYTVKFLL